MNTPCMSSKSHTKHLEDRKPEGKRESIAEEANERANERIDRSINLKLSDIQKKFAT